MKMNAGLLTDLLHGAKITSIHYYVATLLTCYLI
jgi:hypothetical protein